MLKRPDHGVVTVVVQRSEPIDLLQESFGFQRVLATAAGKRLTVRRIHKSEMQMALYSAGVEYGIHCLLLLVDERGCTEMGRDSKLSLARKLIATISRRTGARGK